MAQQQEQQQQEQEQQQDAGPSYMLISELQVCPLCITALLCLTIPSEKDVKSTATTR